MVRVGDSDVGDGEPTHVSKRNIDWSYCIISGAGANSPVSQGTLKMIISDAMG